MFGHGHSRVLVVEDDHMVRLVLRCALRKAGYDVDMAGSAAEARMAMAHDPPDLVLLDLGLPDADGGEILLELRSDADEGVLPVIVVTSRNLPEEKVRLLRMGADDYLVKPFDNDELVARVDALFRRARMATKAVEPVADDIVIDIRSRRAVVRGETVDLRAREFDLLVRLASEPARVFSREELLVTVWKSSADWQDDATVTEHIRRLRRKIEVDPDAPRHLVTIRGAGYTFRP